MAIGRISIKIGSKGKGLAHAKYIMREDRFAKRSEDKGEILENKDNGNMPSWAKENPNFLWEMADKHERKNGSVYREHIISLPREMNESQRLELVQDWIKQEIGDKHPYSYAIHNPQAMDGKEQPHCHLMICERTLDGIDRGADQFFKRYNSKDPTKGGAKKANTGLDHTTRKEQIKQQRDRWEKMCNKHLERMGSRERVSLKNYKERGVEQPQNISMTDMLKPEIKQAYQEKLHARAELRTALFERIKTVGMTSKALADIEQRQKTTPPPQEIKKQREVTAVTEQKPQIITETYSKPVEPLQKSKRIDTTTPPQKSLETPNKPQNEPNKSDIAEKQNLIKDYAKKVQTTAKAILDSQLKALREKSKPVLEKYNTLKDSKPLMFGKDKWEQDTNNALKQYNAIKTTHDNLKDKGVTDDHYKQAREHIAKKEPSYYAQVQQAIKDLESHKQAENAKFAREHGADKLATNGEYYSGKILKITEKGAYQQTSKGIVLHPTYANDKTLKLDKSYDLDYREADKTGQVLRSETYEVRLPSKSQEQDMKR